MRQVPVLVDLSPRWVTHVLSCWQVGIQMNYNKLCACVVEDAIHPNFVHALAKVCPALHPH